MATRKEGSRAHRRSFGSARQQLKAHGHGSNPQEDGGRTEAAVGEAEERVIKEPAHARANRSGSKDRLMDYGIDMLQRQMDTQLAEPVNNTFRSVHRLIEDYKSRAGYLLRRSQHPDLRLHRTDQI